MEWSTRPRVAFEPVVDVGAAYLFQPGVYLCALCLNVKVLPLFFFG